MDETEHGPPPLAEWLLAQATDSEVRYAALGDFAEHFSHLLDKEGLPAARRWYWAQALKSVPSFLADVIYWKISMFRNYFLVALRGLARRKAYSSINIAGLSVGIAGFLLIWLYVSDELSYDSFHEDADNIFRVVVNYADSPGTTALADFQSWGNARVGPALLEEFPEVLEQVRFSGRHQLLLSRDERSFQEERYMYVDHNVFNLFSFELTRGNPQTALVEPGSIVLTQTAARRYFGDQDPMGQALTVDSDESVVVTGIMEDVPANSHLDFDMLMSMSTIEEGWHDYQFDWGYVDFFTYIRLHEEADIKHIAAKMPAFQTVHRTEYEKENNRTREYAFENIREAYLSPTGNFQAGPKGNRANLTIFSLVAFFILLIACVNYMNLSTARASERAKEIGVRKVMGAQRDSLVGQFLSESLLFAGIAILGAFAIAAAFLPAYAEVAAKPFVRADLFQPHVLGLAAAIVLGVGLLAGSYPALILSRFQPGAVLKGDFSTSRGGTLLRKGLVVFQFAITFALIAGSATVYSQLEYMQSQRLGFDQDRMMTMEFGFDSAINSRMDYVREAFLRHPAVSSVALSRTVPGEYFPQGGGMVESDNGEMVSFGSDVHEVDYDYIEHFNMEMAAGRGYSREFETDLDQALVINEASVRDIGYTSNAEAIGKRFSLWGQEGVIIGVVKDFNYVSLQQKISPLSIRLSPQASKFITVKLNTDDLVGAVADMKGIFATLAPHRPFLNKFLDETIEAQYRAEIRFGGILRIFAGLAIFIACLGLVGLTAAVTSQRRREISVRKVLGASVQGIVVLLAKDFAGLVVIASVIATPIVYVGMSQWLNGFAFRTALSPWTFVQAGLAALAIAMISMNYQTIRAALADPVDSLRSS
jgi:putative ABC transport system permease protein